MGLRKFGRERNKSCSRICHTDEVTVETQETGSPRQGNHNDDTTEVVTPETRRPTTMVDPENYDDSVTPRNFRLIEDVYQETEEVEIEDELLLMGIDEPSSYSHAVKWSR